MALTRIKTDQITDSAVVTAKIADSNVTSAKIEDNLVYGSNLTVSGNLTVNGTTTTIDTTNTLVEDPILVISKNATAGSADAGFLIERGSDDNVAFIYDESADIFAFANVGSEDGTTAGNITIDSYIGIQVGSIAVDNITISGNDISSTSGVINLDPTTNLTVNTNKFTVAGSTGNTSIAGTLDVTGDVAINTNKFTVAATSGNTAVAGTLTVTDAATLSSTLDVTGNTTVGGTFDATGAATLSSTLDVTGATGIDGDFDIATNKFTVASATGNTAVAGTLNVTGESTLASATVSDLTSGRVTLAGTAGALEDSANLTFDGSELGVTGTAAISSNATVGGTLGVTGEATLASATVSDLTSGRVVLAGTAGAVEDSANLTFDGSEFSVTGTAAISSNATVGGTLGVTSNTTVGGTFDATGAVTLGSTLDVTGATGIDGDFDINTNKFTVASATGNTAVAGTLDVTGAATLGSTLDVTGTSNVAAINATGLASLDGGIDVDGAFTVADTSGNVATSGTFDATGAATLGSTLDVTGAATLSSTLGVTGAATLSSTLDVTGATGIDGDFDIATNKFTVASATGNTAVAGTLDVTGATNVAAINATGLASLDGGIDVDGAFTVADTSGNIATTGTIDVDGQSTFASANIEDLTNNQVVIAGTDGELEGDANFTFDGTDLNVGDGAFTVEVASGNTGIGGTLEVTGAVTANAGITVDNITIDGDTISSAHDTITIDPSTAGAGGTVVIAGNLSVTGTTTTVDSTVVTIADPVFQLGEDSDDSLDRGIKALYNDGVDSKSAFFGLDESASEFVFIADATDAASVFSGSLGSAAFGSLRVTDLTDNRIAIVGASGELEDDANFTFDGTNFAIATDKFTVAVATGNTAVAGTLGVTGETTLASATVSDLTDNRIVLAGVNGALEDDANLTFNGTTLDVGAGNFQITAASGNTSIAGTLDVTGATGIDGDFDIATNKFTVASATGNTSVAGTLGVTGATTLSSTLDVTGATGIDGNFDVATDKFTVNATSGNTTVAGTIDVEGQSTFASANIEDLTSGRVVLAGTDGELEDNANLAFDGSELSVTGTAAISSNATVGGTIDVDGQATLASANIEDLTSGRVVLAGTSGELEDNANLAFDGSELSVTGTAAISSNATVGGTFGATGAATLSSTLDVAGLASLDGGIDVDGAFTVADTSGNIATSGTLDVTGATGIDGDFDIATNKFTVASATGNTAVAGTIDVDGQATLASANVEDLTSGRVVLAGTSGELEDNANLTFDGSELGVTGTAAISSNATVGGTLGVTGATTLSSTLDVTSAATFEGAVVANATANFEGAITANAAATFNENVTVDTAVLSVTGSAVVDNVTIDGDSIISSNALTLDAAAGQDIVINEAGAEVDFRVEGQTQGNLFFVDASADAIGIKTNAPGVTLDISSANDAIHLPVGTTAQRPTAAAGQLRFNSTIGQMEHYNGTEWVTGTVFTIVSSDVFTGDGSTTTFTLTEDTGTTASTLVMINGVVQQPTAAYSVSSDTLTLDAAPVSGDVVEVRQLTTSTSVASINNGDGESVVLNPDNNSVEFSAGGNLIATLDANGLTVNATLTTIESTNTVITDNLLELNSNVAANSSDSGIIIERGTTGDNAIFAWDESEDKFVVGTTTATASDTGDLTITLGTIAANLFEGTSTSARYADLAENYAADAEIAPGTVVCFGGSAEVTTCEADADRKVAGVVSTNPAHLMNSEMEAEHVVAVALTGRVPAKVTGTIRKGDMLVSAGNGMARAEADPKMGAVIGKALEDFDGAEGVIEVVVGRM